MLSHSDQNYVMNTILLEVAIAENLRTDDLYISYKKETKEWRICRVIDRKIMFKKIFK